MTCKDGGDEIAKIIFPHPELENDATAVAHSVDSRHQTTTTISSGGSSCDNKKRGNNKQLQSRRCALAIGSIVVLGCFVALGMKAHRSIKAAATYSVQQPVDDVVTEQFNIITLKNHNNANDECWIEIHGNIYDLTSYAPKHPGGAGFLTSQCGMRATNEFALHHPETTLTLVKLLLVGEFVDSFDDDDDDGDDMAAVDEERSIFPTQAPTLAPDDNSLPTIEHSNLTSTDASETESNDDDTAVHGEHTIFPTQTPLSRPTNANHVMTNAPEMQVNNDDIDDNSSIFPTQAPILTTSAAPVLLLPTVDHSNHVMASTNTSETESNDDDTAVVHGDHTISPTQTPLLVSSPTIENNVMTNAPEMQSYDDDDSDDNSSTFPTQAPILTTSAAPVLLLPTVDHSNHEMTSTNAPEIESLSPHEDCVTLQVVATHNTRADCWIAFYSQIYDMTTYLDEHIGGVDPLLGVCGTDATNDFEQHHPRDYIPIHGLSRLYVNKVCEVVATVSPTKSPVIYTAYPVKPVPPCYGMVDIFPHNTPSDCWLVLYEYVYDLSLFDHPGGPDLMSPHCGTDATSAFSQQECHSGRLIITFNIDIMYNNGIICI